MNMECPSCKSLSVVADQNFTETHLVCTSCGIVVRDDNLVASTHEGPIQSANEKTYSSVSKKDFFSAGRTRINNRGIRQCIFRRYLEKPALSAGKLESLKRLDYLAETLQLTRNMRDDAKQMFLQLTEQKRFHQASMRNKTALAACCAYIVMRQGGCAVTIQQVCNTLSCRIKHFHAIYKTVLQITGANITPASVDELVDTCVNSIGLGDQTEKVVTLTKDILRVAKACSFIVGGGPPRKVVASAAYVAWKSLQWPKKVTRQQFSKLSKIAFTSKTSKTVTELEELIASLARKIPWLEGCISGNREDDVMKYLDDVIKYPSPASLWAEVKKDMPQTVEVPSISPAISSTTSSRYEYLQQEFNEDMEEDISDSEIESYIRSDAEVVALKALKRRLIGID